MGSGSARCVDARLQPRHLGVLLGVSALPSWVRHPQMALTDVAIRNAKVGKTALKLFDGGGPHLFVSFSGGKLWRMKYRHLGKTKPLSLGFLSCTVTNQDALASAEGRLDRAKDRLETTG